MPFLEASALLRPQSRNLYFGLLSITAWNLPASREFGKSKQKIDCVDSRLYKKLYSFSYFWFKTGYIYGLNEVIYVFVPSQDFGIKQEIFKTPSSLRKVRFSRYRTNISRLPHTAIRRLLRLTVSRILNYEENGDDQL